MCMFISCLFLYLSQWRLVAQFITFLYHVHVFLVPHPLSAIDCCVCNLWHFVVTIIWAAKWDLCLLCICMRLFICALWSPAGKGLTSWLSFVVSSCEFVTFPLVSWIRCGTWLYRFLIFAPLLTFNNVVYATSKASDQPAHTRSLIRAFAGGFNILW